MSFENYQVNKKNENDECTIHGVCSISPTASAIKSTIFGYMQELAFYILKVHEFGARNQQLQNEFIEIFSTLIPNLEYGQEALNHIIPRAQEAISSVKNLYLKLCEEKNIQANFFKNQIKVGDKFTTSDIVKQGQKYSDKMKAKLSEDQKNSFEIILIILKSICLYIVELQEFNVDIDKYYEELLIALNIKDFNELSNDDLKKIMGKYTQIDNELMKIVSEAKKVEFGEINETDVLLSQKEGKAILIAGANIKDLESLLEATKDKGINVYTYGQMIAGHTYEKLRAHPHLVGHYGKGPENYISDFSSFPGAILLTKLSLFNVEKLCSCSFFTTDKITPLSTTPIKNNDFEPIINSALRADGFNESEPERKEKFGINEQNYLAEITKLCDRINKKEIKHVLFFGAANKTDAQDEYFKKIWSLLTKECFVITFHYKDNFKNILSSNTSYCIPYVYKALDILLEQKQMTDFKINIFNSRCEPHTIANIINLKAIGVNRVYFSKCATNIMNPSLSELLVKLFEFNEYTTPGNDIKIMLSE